MLLYSQQTTMAQSDQRTLDSFKKHMHRLFSSTQAHCIQSCQSTYGSLFGSRSVAVCLLLLLRISPPRKHARKSDHKFSLLSHAIASRGKTHRQVSKKRPLFRCQFCQDHLKLIFLILKQLLSKMPRLFSHGACKTKGDRESPSSCSFCISVCG